MPTHTMARRCEGEMANAFLHRVADSIGERIATIPKIADEEFMGSMRSCDVVLLAGAKRHGKDTAADVIMELGRKDGLVAARHMKRHAFADPLKEIVWETAQEAGVHMERAWLYGSDAERELPRNELASLGGPALSGRRLLQLAGTELGREQFGADIWTNAWRHRLTESAHEGAKLILTPDCRFPSEVSEARAARGTVLQMMRAEGVADDPTAHISERPLPLNLVDCRIQCAFSDIRQRVTAWWNARE